LSLITNICYDFEEIDVIYVFFFFFFFFFIYIYFRLLGYEGVEVINPDGGKDDVDDEVQRGRWKPEVLNFVFILFNSFIVKDKENC